MREKEIYKEALAGQMPDIEKVRADCLATISEKPKRKWLRVAIPAAVCTAAAVLAVAFLPKWMDSTPILPTPSVSAPTLQTEAIPQPTGTDGHYEPGTGVYLPAAELPVSQEGEATEASMIALVVYNGKMYTGAGFADKSLRGEYLGKASGNIDERSEPEAYEAEFAATVVGDVYTVIGYDKAFRICVELSPEYENTEQRLFLMDNLNGVYLTTGADLYGDTRLRLRGRYTAVEYRLHDDWDNGRELYRSLTALSDETVAAFVDSLYEAPFVDARTDDMYADIYHIAFVEDWRQAHLYFRLEDGTTVGLRLFENGYVAYEHMFDRVFLQPHSDLFNAVFAAAVR